MFMGKTVEIPLKWITKENFGAEVLFELPPEQSYPHKQWEKSFQGERAVWSKVLRKEYTWVFFLKKSSAAEE